MARVNIQNLEKKSKMNYGLMYARNVLSTLKKDFRFNKFIFSKHIPSHKKLKI